MLPLFLIIVFSLYVFYCIIYMVRKGDDLHAFSFFVLYIYTIFAQIGYVFFPDLSKFLNAYYGEDLFYDYWIFMFLSFVFSFMIYRHISFKRSNIIYITKRSKINRSRIFILLSLVLFLCLNLYFYSHRELFAWGGSHPMGSSWFVVFFRYFVISTFILYVLVRNNFSRIRLILLILYLFFFLQVTSAAGVRSDILYFFIAIAVYELSPFIYAFKKRKMAVLKTAILSFFLIQGLLIILQLRTQTDEVSITKIFSTAKGEKNNQEPLYAKILFQDYYSPSHPLFISMHYNYIDPIEVLKSNVANSFIGFHYPYLTDTIVGFVDNSLKRGEGWAFHFFIEGFNVMGYLGVIYNGIMWNLLMGMWLLVLRTNNPLFRKALYALLAYYITLGMRSQSSYFFLVMIYNIVPAVVMFAYATNNKIELVKKRTY